MTAVAFITLAAIIFSAGIRGCLKFVIGSIFLLIAGSMLGSVGVVLAFISVVGLAVWSIFGRSD